MQHATNYAIATLTRRPKQRACAIDQIKGLDVAVLQALENVGKEVGSVGPAEPFWEDEPRDELGFAFEKQVSQQQCRHSSYPSVSLIDLANQPGFDQCLAMGRTAHQPHRRRIPLQYPIRVRII